MSGRRLRDAGAATAIVYTRGCAEYPAPLRLYRSVAFEPLRRRLLYLRQARA